MKQNTKVEIIGNYEYSKTFIGLIGIVVKTTDLGANLFVAAINGGGSYEDQIFWFPFDCFTELPEPVKKGDNITIIGRRWFDRINGNTYFSAVGLVNGEQVVNIDYEYGYGNHYEDRIFQELAIAGYCSDREKYTNGGSEAFWQYCNRKGITKYVTHSDVNRKKDL